MDLRCQIRWMLRGDMPQVLDIENRSFDFPWSESDFIKCLRQRNCIGRVADMGDRIGGFYIYELHKTRLHILNFAVDYDFRRCRIGTAMVLDLTRKLNVERRNRILLEVRESNLDAQLFFRKMGFQCVNTLRNYYLDSPGEDAYVMQFKHPTCTEAPCTTALQTE